MSDLDNHNVKKLVFKFIKENACECEYLMVLFQNCVVMLKGQLIITFNNSKNIK